MSTETTSPISPAFELNGLPLFVFTGNEFDEVESQGHNHYYVLAAGKEKRQKTTAANATVMEDVDIIKLYRVTNSVLGRAVVESNPTNSGISFGTAQHFSNNLPLIPFDLINKMDAFFREVYKQHGTESILMLVYNKDYLGTDNPSSGWGAIAPKQKNTGAFCDYDPTSVVDELPDNVQLVGSAHSHPQMDAYASGTDHKDQADWDGIHITYGWKSHVRGGATEYYVEIQYAGKVWTNAIDQVAELAPRPLVPKEDIDSWLDNVTKGTVVHTHSHPYSHSGSYNPKAPGTTSTIPKYTGGHGAVTSNGNGVIAHRAATKLPQDAPNPATHVIIGVVPRSEDALCPFCGTVLSDQEFDHHRCLACYNFITDTVGSEVDFNADRARVKAKDLPELDLRDGDRPIVLWLANEKKFTEDIRVSPKK